MLLVKDPPENRLQLPGYISDQKQQAIIESLQRHSDISDFTNADGNVMSSVFIGFKWNAVSMISLAIHENNTL